MLVDTGNNSGLVNSLTGRAEKAVIIIYDGRKILEKINKEEIKDWSVIKAGASGPASSYTNQSAGYTVTTNLGSEVASGAVMQKEAQAGHYQRKYHVKFNPSSLSIDASGGGIYPKEDSGSDGVIDNMSLDLHYYFNAELIFDNYNFNDCFMNHTSNLSVSAVAGGVKDMLLGKGLPVRKQVEAFHAALMNSYTRFMAFCWGPMMYEGIMKSITTNYTMFDKSGNPVRATVRLQMEIIDYQSMVDVNGSQNPGCWQKSFELAFDSMSKMNSLGEFEIRNKTETQMLQNFLNLG